MQSVIFSLTRGTRQECPLSTLLFAMVIELLASCVRDNTNIKWLKINNSEYKISLYADDIILYITVPENSIPHLYGTLEQFGRYWGYKINFSKSSACLLHMTPMEELYKSCSFCWTPGGFKYLINITPHLDNLLKENYTPLIDEIKMNLCKWSTLPLSLLGRINVIRINVLPRFNFIFWMLACYLSAAFFKSLKKYISKCIRCNKTPRMSLMTLVKPEHMGVLVSAISNITFGHLNYETWCHGLWGDRTHCGSRWRPASSIPCLWSLLYVFIKHFNKIKNIDNTLLAWKLGITTSISIYSPIHQNPDLYKHITSIDICKWLNLGIKQFKDLFNKNM